MFWKLNIVWVKMKWNESMLDYEFDIWCNVKNGNLNCI